MVQPVPFSIPVHSKWVPACLDRILDKKVAGAALSCLEKLVDWICSMIYGPYRTLYQAKLQRVHLFSDKLAKVIDCTMKGIAAIHVSKHVNLLGDINLVIHQLDFITLNNKKVYFHQNPAIETIFSRATFTDYVVVKDAPQKGPSWIQIIEQETQRPRKDKPIVNEWFVDTEQPVVFQLRLGRLALFNEPILLVEAAPPAEPRRAEPRREETAPAESQRTESRAAAV